MPFEAYLLSLRPDDALALCVLIAMAAVGAPALVFGRFVSPRSEG